MAKQSKNLREVAESKGGDRLPYNWDKAISVAYLRLIGASQEVAAKEAGCSERSVATWEKKSWWPDAQAEARQRWLRGGDAMARRGLLRALSDGNEYAATSRWWADRRIPELKPPKVRSEISGPDGEPVEVGIEDARTQVADVVARLAAAVATTKDPSKSK